LNRMTAPKISAAATKPPPISSGPLLPAAAAG
jgi:hypothetical protein